MDEAAWNHAQERGLVIVTKDTDSHERSVIHGAPPKVVWIRRGNCSTAMIEQILRRHRDDVQQLSTDSEISYVMVV